MLKECEKENWQSAKVQKVERKGSKEDRNCDGMTALRQARKWWEKNGEQEQNIGGIGDC